MTSQEYLLQMTKGLIDMSEKLDKITIQNDVIYEIDECGNLKNGIRKQDFLNIFEATFAACPLSRSEIMSDNVLKCLLEEIGKKLDVDFSLYFPEEKIYNIEDINDEALKKLQSAQTPDEINKMYDEMIATATLENDIIICKDGIKIPQKSLSGMIKAMFNLAGDISRKEVDDLLKEVSDYDLEARKTLSMLRKLDILINTQFNKLAPIINSTKKQLENVGAQNIELSVDGTGKAEFKNYMFEITFNDLNIYKDGKKLSFEDFVTDKTPELSMIYNLMENHRIDFKDVNLINAMLIAEQAKENIVK